MGCSTWRLGCRRRRVLYWRTHGLEWLSRLRSVRRLRYFVASAIDGARIFDGGYSCCLPPSLAPTASALPAAKHCKLGRLCAPGGAHCLANFFHRPKMQQTLQDFCRRFGIVWAAYELGKVWLSIERFGWGTGHVFLISL